MIATFFYNILFIHAWLNVCSYSFNMQVEKWVLAVSSPFRLILDIWMSTKFWESGEKGMKWI